MDNIAGFDVSFQSIGLVALGAFAFWLILTGKLLPKSLVDSLLKAKDEVISSQRETIEAYEESSVATKKLYAALNDKATEKAASDGT